MNCQDCQERPYSTKPWSFVPCHPVSNQGITFRLCTLRTSTTANETSGWLAITRTSSPFSILEILAFDHAHLSLSGLWPVIDTRFHNGHNCTHGIPLQEGGNNLRQARAFEIVTGSLFISGEILTPIREFSVADLTERQLAQNSVYAGLATSVGFTLLLAISFSLLRPYNSVVYAPKLKVADDRHAPPPMGKGVFAWVGPILKATEQELVALIGLDAVVFLRILKMCRNIFLALTIIGCGILIPINLSKPSKAEGYDTITVVSKVTPANVFGSANWGMTICARGH